MWNYLYRNLKLKTITMKYLVINIRTGNIVFQCDDKDRAIKISKLLNHHHVIHEKRVIYPKLPLGVGHSFYPVYGQLSSY